MARVVVSVEGERQTVKNIGLFDMKKKQAARSIVKKSAARVKKKARADVSVSPASRKKSSGSPGDLKKSIRTKYYYEGLGAMVMPAKPKGSHRHLVEYGTKKRTSRRGNRGKMKANPFMGPAKQSEEGSYNRQMKSLFEGKDETI
jgi:HK97 gp10 family phage protein